jgi:hypothetical protein
MLPPPLVWQRRLPSCGPQRWTWGFIAAQIHVLGPVIRWLVLPSVDQHVKARAHCSHGQICARQAAAQLRLAEAGREVEVLRAKLTAASSAAASNGKTLVEQRQELKQVSIAASTECHAQQLGSKLSCVSVTPRRKTLAKVAAP